MANDSPHAGVIFVGAFAETGQDGTVGGITLACRTLLAASRSRQINWLLVDSTASTNLSRGFLERATPALKRLFRVLSYLVTRKAERIIIFAAHGGSFYEKGLMAVLARLFGVAVIFCPRSGFLLSELPGSRIQAFWARRVFASCDMVICQSEFWRTFYTQYARYPERLEIVQNWVDTDAIVPGVHQKRYPVVTILYMSWVAVEKGIFELIEASAQLVDEGFRFNVIVCGGGDALATAKDRVKQLGLENVEFRGWVGSEQKAHLLQRVHLCVLPSYTEGLSNMMLEAMASGLPLVSTDVGAAKDVIDDGVNGLLIPARSTKALKKAIALLLSDPAMRESIGAASRDTVERHNSIAVGTERFLSLALTVNAPINE